METAGDTFSKLSLRCFAALALPTVRFPWLLCLQPLILSRQKVVHFTQTSPNSEFKECFFAFYGRGCQSRNRPCTGQTATSNIRVLLKTRERIMAGWHLIPSCEALRTRSVAPVQGLHVQKKPWKCIGRTLQKMGALLWALLAMASPYKISLFSSSFPLSNCKCEPHWSLLENDRQHAREKRRLDVTFCP